MRFLVTESLVIIIFYVLQAYFRMKKRKKKTKKKMSYKDKDSKCFSRVLTRQNKVSLFVWEQMSNL